MRVLDLISSGARISGLGMLGGATDGVAYGAHIGGFLAGMALVKVFAMGVPTSRSDVSYFSGR
jgi:membrane associated rhomboid family serine protease